MKKIRIVQVGLGPLGQKITRYLLERHDEFKVVAAVDPDINKAGQDLGELCGAGNIGVRILKCFDSVLSRTHPVVAILTTVSDLKRITPQLLTIVSRGIHIVSTCEELVYPWRRSPVLARRIDTTAKRHNVAVLATGVNPGFLMDFLPISLTAVSQRVNLIQVIRVQDAACRRLSFQKKIGAGLSLKEFRTKQREGTLRHVGLEESIAMIADRMGWKLDRIQDILSPVVSTRRIRSTGMTIGKGRAAGVQQIGRGFVNGKEKITLVFRASIGELNPGDRIEIYGEPNLVFSIPGGMNGDVATCAIAINAAKQILSCRSGLLTMADIPALSYSSN